MTSSIQLAHFHFHCSMPRPPNRRRSRTRTRRRTSFSFSSNPSSPSDPPSNSISNSNSIAVVIDLDHLSLSSSNSHLRRLISTADDALSDLRTLVSLDHNRRLVLSCRRSTLRFLANSVAVSFVAVLGFRALFWLLSRLRSSVYRGGAGHVVVRRDRSLGGKEVVVARRAESLKALSSPLSSAKDGVLGGSATERVSLRKKRLPKWWPSLEQNEDSFSLSMVDNQEYQRDADRLIRAITDNRMSGKDIVADDIIQIAKFIAITDMPKKFPVCVSSYVEYAGHQESPSHSSFVQIDGEDIRQFIAGLAENIMLENTRAARIVTAAVAARTRSLFLQAWALEMQGKHAEAMLELSKICLILRIFPPEESSPEMEMVARGLAKNLKLEQREFLMDKLVGFCDEQSRKIAAEALGLMSSPTYIGDQQ
ncbi:hypothetical protein TIFTF001_032582 [Ficus carica]|uniref:Uncharacterized protein n=1 Tax=Ficus carica TaxID=3494 RepID=A0AA88J6W8_FICCA|nr:hypothetical protein TIFTF001_032582 [Ficus carica]